MTTPPSTDSTKGISVPEPLKPGVYRDRILVNGVDIEWDTKKGTGMVEKPIRYQRLADLVI